MIVTPARSKARAYSSWKTLRRVVFVRGSKIAQTRACWKRLLTAPIVSRTAVGWCAKSSRTLTPPASPMIS
jgi:hypothetical protein